MRHFRNSLKQALVLQCGSANAALSLPADLYVDMWEAIRRNSAPRYAHALRCRGGEPDADSAGAAARRRRRRRCTSPCVSCGSSARRRCSSS